MYVHVMFERSPCVISIGKAYRYGSDIVYVLIDTEESWYLSLILRTSSTEYVPISSTFTKRD